MLETVVFEVNDLAHGLLVVGIVVEPAHLFRCQVGRQDVKAAQKRGLELLELLQLVLELVLDIEHNVRRIQPAKLLTVAPHDQVRSLSLIHI